MKAVRLLLRSLINLRSHSGTPSELEKGGQSEQRTFLKVFMREHKRLLLPEYKNWNYYHTNRN
ncbi:unnamed protein product [Amoebophrya sp. A25]|nr:unnamed protein product [Amoebophrya sp. A25]|eukprot:GSA25T00025954001.1